MMFSFFPVWISIDSFGLFFFLLLPWDPKKQEKGIRFAPWAGPWYNK